MEIKVTLLYSRSQWIGESPKLKLRLAPSEFYNTKLKIYSFQKGRWRFIIYKAFLQL